MFHASFQVYDIAKNAYLFVLEEFLQSFSTLTLPVPKEKTDEEKKLS